MRSAPRSQACATGCSASISGWRRLRCGQRVDAEGSLIAAIEALRGEGRSLRPYQVPALNDVEKWLADNELLDPEGPEEIFKPLSQRGLLRRLRHRFHFRKRRTLRQTHSSPRKARG